MNRLSRALTAAAALLLLAVFAVPIWSIQLVAPQYPEGLGMMIAINTIRGVTPNDLDNINELNHYIGMKQITPAAIPELHIMPWALGVIAVAGLLVALLARRRLLVAWAALFGIASAAGLYDFWHWEYDYGHNIDIAHAIIKIPGMSYQPPLIGVKQLLNFTAVSWPAAGGWMAFGAFALAALAVIAAYRRGEPSDPATTVIETRTDAPRRAPTPMLRSAGAVA